MLSMGLFARAYQTTNGALGLAINSVVLDYPSACQCEAGECERRTGDPFDKVDATVVAWHQTTLVFFDDSKQIGTKAQSRIDVLPKNYSGIAAYNIEMDDFGGACDGSMFARLNAIRGQIEAARKPK
ncbi:uncharacterized protein LOC142587112 [Dermacentor variabilis]|uniref:uncharacterized protein LOC142587112 n=1 Tax=Dermacentor variabilis TaxID=34621 RepID=UPI003F5BBEED